MTALAGEVSEEMSTTPRVRLSRARHLRACSFRPRSATAKVAVVKTCAERGGSARACGRGGWAMSRGEPTKA